MADLGSSWPLGLLIVLAAAVRLAYTFWPRAPRRAGVLESVDAGLVAFVLVFLVIRPFILQAFFIPSASMRPALREADRLLVNKFIYRLTEPRRGDIIVFRAPLRAGARPGHEDYIKRVVALPGEQVEVRSYRGVYVNGCRLAEPYVRAQQMADYDFGPYRVPPGCLFVMGDNRRASQDSHVWLALEQHRIIGKALVVFWPPQRAGLLAGSGQRPTLEPPPPMPASGG